MPCPMSLQMSLQIQIANYATEAAAIQSIRRRVFSQEQNVPESLDIDGQDPTAQHLLAYVDQQAVATLRLRCLDGTLAKIERLAVLAAYRRQGIAHQLMVVALEELRSQGIQTVIVHAQRYIQPLYDRLDFIPQGEPFWEAGIEHLKMQRSLEAVE